MVALLLSKCKAFGTIQGCGVIIVKSRICLAVLSQIVLSINAERSSESGFRKPAFSDRLTRCSSCGIIRNSSCLHSVCI